MYTFGARKAGLGSGPPGVVSYTKFGFLGACKAAIGSNETRDAKVARHTVEC